MNYTEVNFTITDEQQPVLVALLDDAGYEGFVESSGTLTAYISESQFNSDKLNSILNNAGFAAVKYSLNIIREQNWNAVWESNFEPVYIDDFCTIRAPFHSENKGTTYDILIEPKMSFGTGHHETTRLVITLMKSVEFKNKMVLDMGCGTGILAILASKIGAGQVTAVDFDKWAYTNAIENTERNNVDNVQILHGDIHVVNKPFFDVILANINKIVLMNDIKHYACLLSEKGILILSGILETDEEDIKKESNKNGLKCMHVEKMNRWLALLFVQNN